MEKERAFYVVDIKSNPIHNFFLLVWRTQRSFFFLSLCAPSHPMSLSTEVDFLPLKEKLEKRNWENWLTNTWWGGWYSCEGDSHTKVSTHTAKNHPHNQPLCTFRRFSIWLSRKISFALLMQNSMIVWVD